MSIVVQDLVKVYGIQRALDSISFEARPGEVLGFLGPNGAGKTTTMKIVTGYLTASSGTATVCGHDVETDSLAARQLVGYLPEHNPLYLDQYVREYLRFVARTVQVENALSRIDELVELTGLQREAHKRIGALSKGYRQRVGLAQALLHDPPVLILDEPTSGLDPNQLAEIRQLIKELGREKTVVLSTHIMQEVQAVCDRVVIIDQGQLVADDPIARLSERIAGSHSVVISFEKTFDKADQLAEIQGVKRVERIGPKEWRLYAHSGADPRKSIFQFASQNQLVLLEMRREELGMEEVFRHLTGRQNEAA